LIQLGSDEQFGSGFVFSDDVLGVHSMRDGQSYLLVNPRMQIVRGSTRSGTGKHLSYARLAVAKSDVDAPDIRDEDVQMSLYHLALHEVTHLLGSGDHDSDFAAYLGAFGAAAGRGTQFVGKIAKAVVSAVREESATQPASGPKNR
jgi:hypothetical protein